MSAYHFSNEAFINQKKLRQYKSNCYQEKREVKWVKLADLADFLSRDSCNESLFLIQNQCSFSAQTFYWSSLALEVMSTKAESIQNVHRAFTLQVIATTDFCLPTHSFSKTKRFFL